MQISYKKLWELMRANKMKKGELFNAAELTYTARHQLIHNEPVNLKVLMNLCKIFHCDIGDVAEFIENDDILEESV